MASIFLSHNTKDKAAAQQLKAWLEAEKRNHYVFLDDDVQTGIKGGADWERTLYEQLRRCRVFIPLLTQNWNDSQWCFAEMTHARAQGKVILPVKLDPALETPKWFSDLQHIPIPIDLNNQDQSGFQRLQRALDEKFPWKPERSPYPGLLAFQTDDAAIYFGRDLEITRAIEKLEEFRRFSYSSPHFVLLLGASGSGKSSFARAGIMSHLKLKKEWLVVEPFMPRTNPIAELAVAFIKTFNNIPALRSKYASSQLEQDLAQTATANPSSETVLLNLVRELRENSPNDITVLLIIDQAEELFVVSDPQRAKQFLALLRAAIEQADGRLMVLATMRSEFLGNFQQHPFRMDVRYEKPFEYETFTLDPLPTECFYEIIRKPAELVGLTIDDDLVERMVVNTGTNDALPLLAYTLRRLWDNENYRKDWRFELKEYLDLGGLEGSIRKAADEALNLSRRNQEELAALKGAFVPAMVKLSHEDDPVRQRARLDKLTPEAIKLLQPFINNRLLITDKDTDDHETLEVAHEALLRAWPQLVHWIDEDRDKLHLFNSLERAAKDWNDHNRQPDLLVHKNDRLKELLELVRKPRFQLHDGSRESEYLVACDHKQQASEAAEKEQQQQEIRNFRRRLTGAGVMVAISLTATGFAFYHYKEATNQAEIAKQKTIEAENDKRTADIKAAEAEAALIWSNLIFDEKVLSQKEINTLWKLAAANESVRDAFAEQLFADEEHSHRFTRRPREITRAIVGLDTHYREEIIRRHLLFAPNHNKTHFQILATSLLVKELASVESISFFNEALLMTKNTSFHSALNDSLIELAAKIDTKPGKNMVTVLVTAIENTNDYRQLETIGNSLAAFTAKIDAAYAQQVAVSLVAAIINTESAWKLEALSNGLAALTARMDTNSAQKVATQLLTALENAKKVNQLKVLINGLTTLDIKTDSESAQKIATSLATAVENTEVEQELNMLSNSLIAFTANVDTVSAQKVATPLLTAIENAKKGNQIKVLINGLVSLDLKIDTVSVQKIIKSLVTAIESAKYYWWLDELINDLIALDAKIDTVLAQKVVAALVTEIENTNNDVETLGNSLAAFTTKIGTVSAQKAMISLLTAVENSDYSGKLKVLCNNLVALMVKLDTVSAQKVVTALVTRIENINNNDSLSVLINTFAALDVQIDTVYTQRVFTTLVTKIENTKANDYWSLITLINSLVALDVQIDTASTQKIVTTLGTVIKKNNNNYYFGENLKDLVNGLVALEAKFDTVSAQQVVTFLVTAIENSESADEFHELTKALVALDVKIDTKFIQKVVKALMTAFENSDTNHKFQQLVNSLVTITTKSDAVSAQKIAKFLATAIKNSESGWESQILVHGLATLATKIDTVSAQKVVTLLVTAIKNTEDYDQLEALGDGLAVLAMKIDTVSSLQVVKELVTAIENTDDDWKLEALSNGLVALAAKIDKDSAQKAARLLVTAIENTEGYDQLAALGNALIALDVKIDTVSMLKIITSLVTNIKTTHHETSIGVLKALNNDLEKFTAMSDATSAQKIAKLLVTAIEKTEDYRQAGQIEVLINGLVVLMQNIDAASTQNIVMSLVTQIENAKHERLKALGNGLTALAAKIDKDPAHKVVMTLVTSIGIAKDTWKLEALGNSLAALTAKIDTDSAQKVTTSFVTAIENSGDYLQFITLINSLIALDVKISTESAQRIMTKFVTEIENNYKDYTRHKALGKSLAELTAKFDTVSAQKIVTSLVTTIENTKDPNQLELLAKGLVTLIENIMVDSLYFERIFKILANPLVTIEIETALLEVLQKHLHEESADKPMFLWELEEQVKRKYPDFHFDSRAYAKTVLKSRLALATDQ